jgi:hypothetical protein
MRGLTLAAAAALLAAGCSGEAPEQNEAEEAPATPVAGQYEASWTVAALRSVDNTTPATNLEQGATGTTTACVAEDGTIDPALFAEDGDECSATNAYVRNGRMSIDLTCRREGNAGEIRQSVSGNYTADALEAEVSTTTYLAGTGDYAMTRSFNAKRLGECPPASASDEAQSSADNASSG